MPKAKVFELKQQRATLIDAHAKSLDQSRTIVEKMTAEKRAATTDEQANLDRLFSEQDALNKRINPLDRQIAAESIGFDDPDVRSAPLPHEDPSNVGSRHRYSILKAGTCILEKRAVDGLEGEVSKEIAHRTQKTQRGDGFIMPWSQRGPRTDRERRTLDSTAGAGAIPTVLDKNWIEILRNRMVIAKAGGKEYHDLQGKFAIPRQNQTATMYYVAESGPVTGSNQTFDQVLFTPHTAGAFTDISRRFFELANMDNGEEIVQDDLTAIIARGVDLAGLNGSGASNQPLGIMQNTGITATRTVALGATGGAPTWAAMVEMHTIVARGNAADLGDTAYIGNADVEGTLATTLKASTFPIFLLEDGKVYNRPFFGTQQLPNNLTKSSGTGLSPIIYGVWNQLITAYWSGIDILIDPYTGSSSGTVRVVALVDFDVQVRHNEAFSVIVDMTSNQTQ